MIHWEFTNKNIDNAFNGNPEAKYIRGKLGAKGTLYTLSNNQIEYEVLVTAWLQKHQTDCIKSKEADTTYSTILNPRLDRFFSKMGVERMEFIDRIAKEDAKGRIVSTQMARGVNYTLGGRDITETSIEDFKNSFGGGILTGLSNSELTDYLVSGPNLEVTES